jgi:hypothetical protein
MEFTGVLAAAILTGIAAVFTAWAAVRRAKAEGTEKCERELREARTEAEATAALLHRMRMDHPDTG